MITVIGAVPIDLVPASDSATMRAIPGAGPLCVAVGAARLGHPTALMARLSGDCFGQILRRHAARNGVDLGAAADADEPATLAVTAPSAELPAATTPAARATPGAAAGSRRSWYFQGTADWQWTAAELAQIPAATSIVHLGSLACCVAPGAARILRAAARQRRRGALVCLDPDVCPEVMGTPARGRLLVERMVMSADVVKASTTDLAWLYPGRALEDVAGHWLSLGPQLAVITCGADGAMALRGTRTVLRRPARRVRVVDTAGAADAFTAALLGGLYQLRQASASLRALTSEDLARLLDCCTTAAGLACERAGAELPTRTELRRALRDRPQAARERSHVNGTFMKAPITFPVH
jgi:fructokinase